MDLYTLVLEHQGNSFTTQIHAPGADEAITAFFSDTYPGLREQAFGPAAPSLGRSDIIYITPMTDLVNIWIAAIGREGQYVSVVCARTVPSVAA